MKLNEILGIEFPIIQGGMANIATAEFAAACSNAGAMGLIGCGGMNTEQLRAEIRKCKSLTDKPFGVNLMLMNPCADEMADMVIEEGVKFLTTGAGNPTKYMPKWKAAGIKVFPVVAAVALAKMLERAGADGVIAEGTESGGHVGETTTMALVPQVVDAVSIPVVAAGGIADGRQLAAAYALGACGAQVGTCLLTSVECPVHQNYKEAVLKAKDRIPPSPAAASALRPHHQKQDGQRIRPAGVRRRYQGGAGALHPGQPAPGRLRRRRVHRQRHVRPGGRSCSIEIKPVRQILEELVAGCDACIKNLG